MVDLVNLPIWHLPSPLAQGVVVVRMEWVVL